MSMFISGIQVVIYIVCTVGTLFLPLSFKYNLQKGDFKKGSILVANHQSRIDFILIFLGIPFHSYLRMLPLYVLTADKYMNTWWKRTILSRIGCIPVNTQSKQLSALGLLKLFEKIDGNNTILIFPEGRVKKTSAIKPFQGIGYILRRSKKPFFPIFVDIHTNVTFLSFLTRRYDANIIYGKPMIAEHSSPQEISEFVMKTIYSLS